MKAKIGDIVLYYSGDLTVPAVVISISEDNSATLNLFTPRGNFIKNAIEFGNSKKPDTWFLRKE